MSETKNKSSLPWYQEGLRFKCTQCGKCCTGSPGYIWVNEEEIAEMAQFLNLSIKQFKRLYLRQKHNRYLLIEKKSQNHDCIFLKDKKCLVYAARPLQCRTYPFWKEHLNSEKSWQLAAQECEGIQDQAPIVPYEQITQLLN